MKFTFSPPKTQFLTKFSENCTFSARKNTKNQILRPENPWGTSFPKFGILGHHPEKLGHRRFSIEFWGKNSFSAVKATFSSPKNDFHQNFSLKSGFSAQKLDFE